MNRLDLISFGKIVQIREKISQQMIKGKKVFRFESGDPDFSVAPHVAEAITKALHDGKTHYISNEGIAELRKALSEKCVTKNNLDVTPQDIFVTNGAMHALFVVFQCLLTDGDEVIVPEPLWTEIGENIRLAGGVLSKVSLTQENNYSYSLDAIKQKITPRTKAIFVNSPHNPTGALVPEEELRKIAEFAAQSNLYLVSDEAYEDLVFEGKHFSSASAIPHYHKTISIFSFSKSHAMTGLRVGYIVTKNTALQTNIQKILRCSVNGINSLAQWGALAAVQGSDEHLKHMLKEYKKRRDIFCDALTGIDGLKIFKPHGAFYLWCTVDFAAFEHLNLRTMTDFSNYLIERGIGNAPGDSFGTNCDTAIRFAFSGSTQMIQEGSIILRNILLQTTHNQSARNANHEAVLSSV